MDDIDLQVPLSSDILTDGPLDESNHEPVQYVQGPNRFEPDNRSNRISDEYLINQAAPWTKKESSPLSNQTFYLQESIFKLLVLEK